MNSEGFEKFFKNFRSKAKDNKIYFHESGFGPRAIGILSQILYGNDRITEIVRE
jgi:hypothetical protein